MIYQGLIGDVGGAPNLGNAFIKAAICDLHFTGTD